MTRAQFRAAWSYARRTRRLDLMSAYRPDCLGDDLWPAWRSLADRRASDPLRRGMWLRLALAGYETALSCDGRPPRIIRERAELRAA